MHAFFPYIIMISDQIAVPDFGIPAVENWGLVTYHESALLYEEGVTSLYEEEEVIMIIAHELAHQVRGTKIFVCHPK